MPILPYTSIFFIHKGHLGSYETITDEEGRVVEKLNFDPCLSAETYGQAEGRRRNPDIWTFDNVPEETLFDRGFTGHEHLDVFGLVNMNGRVYDPWLGRMLSPDPILQAPANGQNYNRYTYAMNNPLKYTDPSRYMYGPENEYEPEGYLEEGNYSHNLPIYDAHGAMISFGYGGNNFNNNGFTNSQVMTGDDTNDDGIIDDNYRIEYEPIDNWAVEKGIIRGRWVESGRVNDVSFDTGDGSIQLREYEIISKWVPYKDQTNKGDTEMAYTISAIASVISLTTDVISNILNSTKVGSDIAYFLSNSKTFINTVKYIKPIGYGATGVSVLSDVILTVEGKQSLTETGINTSVTMIAIGVGGWPGLIIQGNYQASKAYMKTISEHPEWVLPAKYHSFYH